MSTKLGADPLLVDAQDVHAASLAVLRDDCASSCWTFLHANFYSSDGHLRRWMGAVPRRRWTSLSGSYRCVGSTWRWHCLPQDGPQLAIGPGLVDGSCVLIWGRGMADVVGDGTGLGLVPLVPVHVPEQHKVYSDELVSLLEDDERRKRVWNIALTGGYGSGKSSVLAGVRERLASRVVEISLSSLSDAGCSRSIDSAMR